MKLSLALRKPIILTAAHTCKQDVCAPAMNAPVSASACVQDQKNAPAHDMRNAELSEGGSN